jgi:hypothetical protein
MSLVFWECASTLMMPAVPNIMVRLPMRCGMIAAAQVVVDGLEPSYLVLRNPLLPGMGMVSAALGTHCQQLVALTPTPSTHSVNHTLSACCCCCCAGGGRRPGAQLPGAAQPAAARHHL